MNRARLAGRQVRVRIAPSPTGQDLHIGNVYTALLNFVFAKKNRGSFVVRIEDTDRTRMVKGAEQRILESLKWLGLIYDEGPDTGGIFGPYRQSERKELYGKYAHVLVEKGNAYYCVCTSERLTAMREEQKKRKEPTLYDGLCKRAKIKRSDLKDGAYVIRLNVPDEGKTEFDDLIRGKISFENRLIDDQVLLKSDGFPTYHLGVVVDDHLMEISHIIRAEEWISSTPKHVLLYKYLGWELPVFAHGPVLRNPDKSKLSKRKNPVWVSWYREQGYLSEAILNYLALIGWSMPDEREIFSIDEMIAHFDLKDVKSVGPAFDINKLEWMNGEYIRKTQNSKLKTLIFEFYNEKLSKEIVEQSIPLVKERIKKLSDYLPLCKFFFEKPGEYEVDLADMKQVLSDTANALRSLSDWNANSIGEAMQIVQKTSGVKAGEFFMAIRLAITGKKISPPLNESMEILGKDEALERISVITLPTLQ